VADPLGIFLGAYLFLSGGNRKWVEIGKFNRPLDLKCPSFPLLFCRKLVFLFLRRTLSFPRASPGFVSFPFFSTFFSLVQLLRRRADVDLLFPGIPLLVAALRVLFFSKFSP